VPYDRLPESGGARDAYADVDLREVVRRALLALPPRQRPVVVLRYFDDLTEAQTAEALGCAVGTVKSQASAALRALRASLPVRARSRRLATVAVAATAAVVVGLTVWSAGATGHQAVQPSDSSQTLELGGVSVRVPAGWAVSEQPPGTWCDARPRTVYLGGTLRDPAGLTAAGAPAPCPHTMPGPLIWLGRAGMSMSSPLQLVRMPGGGLARVELSGISTLQDQHDVRQYLLITPVAGRVQLIASLTDRTTTELAPARTSRELTELLQRIRVAPHALQGRLTSLPAGLAVVTDDRPPGPQKVSAEVVEPRALARLSAQLRDLPRATVDPGGNCFSPLSAATLVDLHQLDQAWREFRARWPGAVIGLGGPEILVGSQQCPYLVDSEGGAAQWRPDLIDSLFQAAARPS
jgi:hypothetical protein